MKRKLFILALAVALACMFTVTGPASAKDLVKLSTCWMPEHELFFGWYAKEKGWDKEEGLDFELLYFESGMSQLEALPAKQWVLGATGGVPHVMGSLRFGAQMIGLGNNESFLNTVFARPDAAVVKTKGWNKNHPKVLGKPVDVKGKTFLVTTASSAHFAMTTYLKTMGLKDSDVIVKQMDQSSIMAAFDSGVGDFACLWAPYSYKAEANGWIEVSNVDKAGAALPINFVGDKDFCEKNPAIVAKFLRVMFRGINKLADEGATDENIKLFQRMYQEWAGMEYSYADAKKDIEMHPVWKLDQQLKIFNASNGESRAQTIERLIAELLLHANGRITDAELAKVTKGDWITDKYLKLVKTPIPPYK
ncbi:MAG: ABC transporter substrate-binding protein [Desulfobacterales bacterium]|nr:ABC transporter substrate-binding protein [Desulfobacterales bacterium]